jgi:hypothetical protein
MRDFKFRAWDRKSKVFIKSSLVNNMILPVRGTRNGFKLKSLFLLLQWVGLKDKAGKEIYEGDCARWKGEMAQVRYEPDYGGYVLEWKWSKNQHHVLLTCDVACQIIIVGNIYENPELIAA